ncbi:hypothetical protein Wenmar_03394 [Wenxinia marina DSM 24838]|uniref:Uncharacterized protein n=2 Tax=Wenxinia TaxID=653686 RepID=A0A0D0PZZ8_9RHOB|nr:hypothetical protein Wenmar_03394 [Wenxinia marina DSM 24838]
MEPGASWRRTAWTKAREALLPSLPLEVVRLRVKRAERLGIDYRTYATIRATSGHDIVAFLFSGNALELRRGATELPDAVAARLERTDAARLAAVYRPADPAALVAGAGGRIDAATQAPAFTDSWAAMRDRLDAALADWRAARAGTVLVAATAVERDWCAAARLAGTIPAERFFVSG